MPQPAPHPGDAALIAQIEAARQRTQHWLATLQAPGQPLGVCRISTAHDPARWPGMLLPGTYNAVMLAALIGADTPWQAPDRAALAGWLLQHRRDDGIFRIPGMADDQVFKKPDPAETWRYIDFHVTNYSLGALQMLAPGSHAVLDFARPWLDNLTLKAWLADRDLRDPWQEGNNIVNLGSFLISLAEQGDGPTQAQARAALQTLLDWHDRLQEPATGFWGVGQAHDPQQLLHAMAGSMHNFHLWYALGRPLPYQNRAVDYALSLPPAVHSACIDVDLVDLLVHAHRQIDHRRPDTEAWLRRLLPALLAIQNPDGGFADVREGTRRQDGWVRGYEEPQGLSNTFATWFRWIAIAMIADTLLPGRWPWQFRRMVGIGYLQPAAP